MKRRTLLAMLAGGGLGLLSRQLWAESTGSYVLPPRLLRPELSTDEGGLWAMMDRQEKGLRRNPLSITDPKLRAYVQGVACRLGGDHCPDIRVTLVRTPLFNANMAPNGMMQVWSGLLLRVENEAQLAAILGHEIGHYLQRHSLDRLRDIKAKSAFGQFLGVFGVVGAIGQLGILASAFAYGQDHEREADRIGAYLMHQAGYEVAESAKVWANLMEEVKARTGEEPEKSSPLFATHPAPPERRDTLVKLAASMPGGVCNTEIYQSQVAPFLEEWLLDEIKRGQTQETLALFGRQIAAKQSLALVHFYRGEVYRLRAADGDLDLALADYRQASQMSNPPPGVFRGMGLVAKRKGQPSAAADAFSRYLELAPDAADSSFIKSYLAELRS